MRDTYDACLDESTIKKLGVGPLLNVIEAIQDKFPTNVELSAKAASIKDTILYLNNIGVSTLLSSGTGADDTNPDVVVISVSPPWRIGLPAKERYEDDKLVAKYKDMVVAVLSALLPTGPKDSFADVIEFEKKLAEASPTQQEREDVTVGTLWQDICA